MLWLLSEGQVMGREHQPGVSGVLWGPGGDRVRREKLLKKHLRGAGQTSVGVAEIPVVGGKDMDVISVFGRTWM